MKLSSVEHKKNYKGSFYEKKACLYLKKNNYEIVTTNYRWKHYEIDIIALDRSKDKKLLVFFEVKYRKKSNAYFAIENTINPKKQKNIIECSEQFLQENHTKWNAYFCRYDVIFITAKPKDTNENHQEAIKINHIKSAYLKH